MSLESILAREAFIAVTARERLDSQVDTLVALQIVISIEALWALIALERAIRVGTCRLTGMAI